jgi:hypothetical protein
MDHILTTHHGAKRMRGRLKTSKGKTDAQALEALDKGLPSEEMGGAD